MSNTAPSISGTVQTLYSHPKAAVAEYYQQRGTDPIENIQQIVNILGQVFNSAAALYNRLENDGTLRTWAIDSPPPGLKYVDAPNGHVCYEKTILENRPGSLSAVAIENLDCTMFKESDINVKSYGLKSYLGFPVVLQDQVVGSLVVVFGECREFSAQDKETIEEFARAVALEEELKFSREIIQSQSVEIQRLNQELRGLNERLNGHSVA
jgi:GAF domain-containing protein